MTSFTLQKELLALSTYRTAERLEKLSLKSILKTQQSKLNFSLISENYLVCLYKFLQSVISITHKKFTKPVFYFCAFLDY